MDLNEFVRNFSNEFEETPKENFTPATEYRNLEEWDSLITLSIISMVDDTMGKRITGADLRSCKTIEELYKFINTKSDE